MINNNKYVNASKMEQPIIKSVGFNNEDVLITDNGEYEAKSPYTGFGKVIVNVSQNPIEYPVGWLPRKVENSVLNLSSQMPDFTGITEIGDYALAYAFYNNGVLTGNMDLSNITKVGVEGLSYAFYYSHIKNVDLSNLTEIKEKGLRYAFYYSEIETVNLSKITEVGNFNNTNYTSGLYYAFYYAENLISVDLSNLITVGVQGLYSTFSHASIKTFTFDKLQTVAREGLRYAFAYSKIESLYFPALLSSSFISPNNQQLYGMLNSVIGCTVHFPSNLQSVIGYWSDAVNGFGGTNTTVLFDLPATE